MNKFFVSRLILFSIFLVLTYKESGPAVVSMFIILLIIIELLASQYKKYTKTLNQFSHRIVEIEEKIKELK